MRGALPPVKTKHFAAITDPKEVGPLLRQLDTYSGTLPVRCALRLAPLVFVRLGELVAAEWAGIDLEGAEWRYTVTKTDRPHVVPLARQAVAILREVHPMTGHHRYVFPNARFPSRELPMGRGTLWSAFRALDIPKERMTMHGFRAMARTILDEVLGFRPDFIEHQLAHAVRDPNGRAYNRTAFLPERRVMMQAWADYLDGLRAGEIEPGPHKAPGLAHRPTSSFSLRRRTLGGAYREKGSSVVKTIRRTATAGAPPSQRRIGRVEEIPPVRSAVTAGVAGRWPPQRGHGSPGGRLG